MPRSSGSRQGKYRMAYSVLVNKAKSTSGAPDFSAGAKIAARKMNATKGGRLPSEYISLTLGNKLAAGLHLSLERHNVALLFGNGDETGQIAMTVDNQNGMFGAKRNKSGQYTITISKETAEGLLKLTFATFYREKVELVKIDATKPVFAIIDIKPALLNAAGEE